MNVHSMEVARTRKEEQLELDLGDPITKEEELEIFMEVRKWPAHDCEGLLMFVSHYFDDEKGDVVDHGDGRWSIATGGNAWHDALVFHMQLNDGFWLKAWESSRRGGHFTFVVPENQL